MATTKCKVKGCTGRIAARGLCWNHYGKARRLWPTWIKPRLPGRSDVILTAKHLKVLATDGRSKRFQEKRWARV